MESPKSAYDTSEVFGVAEILETILLNLPRSDLVRSMRGSKLFRASIEGSVKIQRQLFLLPVPWTGLPPRKVGDQTPADEDEGKYPCVELNPQLLTDYFDFDIDAHGGVMKLWLGFEWDRMSPLARMSPTRPLVPGTKVVMRSTRLEIDASTATFEELKLAEEAGIKKAGDIPVSESEWRVDFPTGIKLQLHGEDWEPYECQTKMRRVRWVYNLTGRHGRHDPLTGITLAQLKAGSSGSRQGMQSDG